MKALLDHVQKNVSSGEKHGRKKDVREEGQ